MLTYLRVLIQGVRAQEPRRYFLSFQILAPGVPAAAALPDASIYADGDTAAAAGLGPDQVCRTETAAHASCPEFANRAFVLRLPAPVTADLADVDSARLAVSLFAAPSLDAPAGPVIAGREVDQVLASGSIGLAADLAARLADGEHVTLRVQLQPEGATGSKIKQQQQHQQRQSMRSSQTTNMYGSSGTQVLLELMMLDAQVQLPSSRSSNAAATMWQHASVGSSLCMEELDNQQGSQATPGAMVQLSVLVSAAVNLPMVPGPDGKQLVPPCALVALKPAADAAPGRPAQAQTKAAPAGPNPVWSQLCSVSYQESALPREQLLVSVVNESTNRVLFKSSVPLSGLLPDHHYNLMLALSDTCSLYLTLCLGLGAKSLLEASKNCGLAAIKADTGDQLRLLQLRLAKLSQPVRAILAGAVQPNSSAGGEVWAVWRTGSSGASQPLQQLHAPFAAGTDAAATTLKGMSQRCAFLSPAPVAANTTGAVLAVLPVFSLQQQQHASEQQLWPHDHMVLLPCLLSRPVAAVLELYLQPYSACNSSTQQRLSCLARLEIPSSAVSGQQLEQPFLLRDLQVQSVVAAERSSPPGGVLCLADLDAVCWQAPGYLEHLKLLLPPPVQPRPAGASSHRQRDASPSPDRQSTALDSLSPANLRGLVQSLDTLVSDVLTKQQALERLQRQLDVADSKSELAAARLADLRNNNSRLMADLQHLRQLLHEEKEAAAAPLAKLGLAISSAPREQLLHQLGVATAAVAKEHARNAELVRRLQQLHSEKVDVLQLQKNYTELQNAHYEQSRLLADQQSNMATIAALKSALADQESVISRLEKVLAGAAARTREAEGWKTTAHALQEEVDRLREELQRLAAARPVDEIAQMASKAAAAVAEQQAAAETLAQHDNAAAAAATDFELRLYTKESERLSALMRAEKAEAAATAAQNELMDVTKRYAREIAQLKTKLAEKDAQLLGGFGSIANMYLGEMPGMGQGMGANSATGTMPGFTPNAAAAVMGTGMDGQQLSMVAQLPMMGAGYGEAGMMSPAYAGTIQQQQQPWQQQQQPWQQQQQPWEQQQQPWQKQQQWQQQQQQQQLGGVAAGMQPGKPISHACVSQSGSLKLLEPILASSSAAGPAVSSPKQQQQQQQQTAIPSPSMLRSGTAEGNLSGRKPGSPLAPLPQPRQSSSAEGLRSASLNASSSGIGSSAVLRSPRRDLTPTAAAATAGAKGAWQQQQQPLPSQQLQQQQQQQQRQQAGKPAVTAQAATGNPAGGYADEYEDEYEDEEEDEVEQQMQLTQQQQLWQQQGAPQQVVRPPQRLPSPQQQKQQQQQQQATSWPAPGQLTPPAVQAAAGKGVPSAGKKKWFGF